MRHIVRSFIVLASLVSASTSQAGNWGLGTNLGFRVLQFGDQGGSVTTFSWPGDALFAHEPGLRLSFAGASRTLEGYLDTGMMFASQTGFSVHTLLVTGNGQLNFTPASSSSPYLTMGGGMVHEGTDTESSLLPSLGAGLGYRFRVAGGHGTIRSELRYDYFGGDENHGVSTVNAYGLKLGFDLWMKE